MGVIERAAELLREGKVVGIPTDTVYGLAADPFQPEAVNSLFDLKGRELMKPIGILVADVDEARSLVQLPLYALEWSERYWPGPLTLVAHPVSPLPAGVGDMEHNTVGVRVPNHPVTLAVLEAFGPLAVTSANPAGGTETLDEVAAAASLGALVPFYLPGHCPGTVASTVVDVTGGTARILRAGPLELGVS
ncbi:MAG TPA: L-threonylcarbamoyladenylate synthase [Acidimicrobiia bacterium]|nr:L-threonylcarbamoyladenylate synthase [Acidimicrobiia bacterium]